MGALAYTQGNNVHFAPGQYNPSSQKGQELLGHELTHVVQQREGRVQPTKQGKGMSVNDSPVLEKEAAEGKSNTTATSTRSLTGKTNAEGVRLVDLPANWDDNAHYDLLSNGTKIKKIKSSNNSWMKVEVFDGTHSGKQGYIMKHFFTGD